MAINWTSESWMANQRPMGFCIFTNLMFCYRRLVVMGIFMRVSVILESTMTISGRKIRPSLLRNKVQSADAWTNRQRNRWIDGRVGWLYLASLTPQFGCPPISVALPGDTNDGETHSLPGWERLASLHLTSLHTSWSHVHICIGSMERRAVRVGSYAVCD